MILDIEDIEKGDFVFDPSSKSWQEVLSITIENNVLSIQLANGNKISGHKRIEVL